MFKGIYLKLVSTYLTLFLIIVVIISFFTTSLFYKEFTNQVEENLLNAGVKTNALVGRYYNNEITKTELTAWINAMGYISNIKIYILNPDATILHKGANDEDMEMNVKIKTDMQSAMKGETVIRMATFSFNSESEVAYVGMPLTYDGKISGVIMIFSPVNEINNLLKTALKTIMTVVVITILIGTLAILRISVKISEPIKEISEGAKRIGKGEDVPDIEIYSNDEIGMLAKSFNEMKKELAVTEQMRKEIVANVSHELRTPLTSIIGFIKGILDGVISKDEEEKYLSIADEEANRLKDLTKDIVDVAKLESGSVSLNKEKFSLNELAKDVYVEMEELVKEKNLKLILEEKENDVVVCADKAKIRQVLINVINNSVKFTTKGYIKVTIGKDGEKAKIIVKDTGIGIQKDTISYLFNKFDTANDYGNATTGAGLGLNIVKNIVDMHGGKVEIESAIGKGTKVTIIF